MVGGLLGLQSVILKTWLIFSMFVERKSMKKKCEEVDEGLLRKVLPAQPIEAHFSTEASLSLEKLIENKLAGFRYPVALGGRAYT